MGMPVRIEDSLYDQAKAAAGAEFRTISGQIEFWAKVGKAALDNPAVLIRCTCWLISTIHKPEFSCWSARMRTFTATYSAEWSSGNA